MDKFIKLLTADNIQRWIIPSAILLIIAILIWNIGPIIAIGGKIPLEPAINRIFIILLIGLTWLAKRLKLLQQMLTQYAKRPQQAMATEQVVLLRQHCKSAIKFLKTVHLKKLGQQSSVYQLPWYLLVGAPKSGKTSLVANSEFTFANVEQFVFEAPDDKADNKYCNWWFADDAVIIDVPGQYFHPKDETMVWSTLWQLLIKLLKKYRPRRPINGIILTCSLHEFISQNSDDQTQLLQTIKQRLHELARCISSSVPIYLLFTKTDVLAGFKEFFSDLTGNNRRQAWGMTFEHSKTISLANINQNFDQEFSALLSHLNNRLLLRMQHERNITKRSLIKDFPLQIESLKSPLRTLLYHLVEVLDCCGQLRIGGIYFCSSLQSGVTIDRLWHSLNTSFQLQPYLNTNTHLNNKAFFVKQFFKEIILRESISPPKLQRKLSFSTTKHSLLTLGSIAGFSSMTVLFLALSFKQKLNLIHATENALLGYKTLSPQLVVQAPTKEYMVQVLQSLTALNNAASLFEQANSSWLITFNLPKEKYLKAQISQSYNQILQTILLPQLRKLFEQQLLDNSTFEPNVLYATLMAYLMLDDPIHFDPNFINTWLKTFAQQTFFSDPFIQQQIQKHLRHALTLSSQNNLNQQAIIRARSNLNRMPPALLAYALINNSNVHGSSEVIYLVDQNNTTAITQGKDSAIPSLYTAAQFQQIYFKESINASRAAIQGNWVLGEKSIDAMIAHNERDQLITEVRNRYLRDYANYWQSALKNLRLKPLDTLDHAIELLESLTQTHSPLTIMVDRITTNTDVRHLTANSTSGDIEPVKTVLGDSFRNFTDLLNDVNENQTSLLKQMLIELNSLKQLLLTIKNANDGGKSAFYLAKSRAQGIADDPFVKLQTLAEQSPEPFRQWLTQISAESWKLVLADTQDYINTLWQTLVLPEYKKNFDNRYPLFKNATQDIALDAFTNFFAPVGTLGKFFNAYLKPFVDTNHPRWQWRRIDNQTLGISSNVLDQFERAAIIQRIYYAANKKQLTIPFAMQALKLPPQITLATVELNGQHFTDQQGTSSPNYFIWPGDQQNETMRLTFKDARGDTIEIRESGPWALFKLLTRGNIQPMPNLTRFILSFDVSGETAKYQLLTSQVMNPFLPGIVDQFRCPEQL